MGAIKRHKTAVDTESAWDGPAAVADAPNDAAVLRYMHAWVDPEGDPEAKSSYKFPHHEPGTDTPAVIAAVNNALARLSQSNIPEADREGVEEHLRGHRQDAGLEEDAHQPLVERRTMPLELRVVVDEADGTAGKRFIEGYAAVFNEWSEDLGGFRERILPGAFAGAIGPEADVRALINHDSNLVLGRSKAGTLEMAEDERGLRVKIHVPETQYGRDLLASMERGDVDQMSFGFTVSDDGDKWYEDDEGVMRRDLINVERLFDVSVVTFPAYPQTVAQARDVYLMRFAGDEPTLEGGEGEPEVEAQTDAERAQMDVKRKKLEILKKQECVK